MPYSTFHKESFNPGVQEISAEFVVTLVDKTLPTPLQFPEGEAQLDVEVCNRLSKSLGAAPLNKVSFSGSTIVNVISLSHDPE